MDTDKFHMKTAVNHIAGICFERSQLAGWWDGVNPTDLNVIGTKIALIHSEVSEALEGFRKDQMDDHLPHRKMAEVELADAIIRIADLAGALGLDLGGALVEKLEYNQHRADHVPAVRKMHGGKKI